MRNFVFFFICLLCSCGSEREKPETDNHIQNSSFVRWTKKVPDYWDTKQNKEHFLQNIPDGVKMEGNNAGTHVIKQEVTLEPQTFYKLQTEVKYNIYDYSVGGVYVYDAETDKLLAKQERTNAENSEILTLKFNSGNVENVKIKIGFEDGINAEWIIKSVDLIKEDFQPVVFNSSFGSYLAEELNLDFSNENFDTSVELIVDFLNGALLANYRSDSSFLDKVALFLDLTTDNYNYLHYYLTNYENANVAYCQKSSLSLEEILNNEFNIPTRSVHLEAEREQGFHQLVEYWNPHTERWIAIDPYYSFKFINENGEWAGIDDLEGNTSWRNYQHFGTNAFSTDIERMESMFDYPGMYYFRPREYTLTYPF